MKQTVRTFKNQAAQGDCLLIRIDSLPTDIIPCKPDNNNEFIIAHSETGHNHVIEASPEIKVYNDKKDPLKAYIEVLRADVILEHKRDFDTHLPISISKGLYEVRRQREYTPEGFRRAAD